MHTHTHTHTYTQTKQKLIVIPSQCYNPLDTKSHQHVLQKPISAIKSGDINFHLNTFEEWRHYGANDQCISYKMNMPVQLTTKIMTRESRNWLGEPWIANKIIQHTRKWLPSDKLWGGGWVLGMVFGVAANVYPMQPLKLLSFWQVLCHLKTMLPFSMLLLSLCEAFVSASSVWSHTHAQVNRLGACQQYNIHGGVYS